MSRSATASMLFAVPRSGPWRWRPCALACPGAIDNNTPLAFGMNVEEASAALGTTLIYVRGRPGDEMFLALPNVKGSALSDRRDGLYLQFRRGKLDGWKGDWGTDHPCCR